MSREIYISGKIGGKLHIADETYEKFHRAERSLTNRGWEPFNPCDPSWQGHLLCRRNSEELISGMKITPSEFYRLCLFEDIRALSTCDAICLLPDWRDSPGAKAELAFAKAIGIEVHELTEYGELARWFYNKENDGEK
jgi:hypothetical protein